MSNDLLKSAFLKDALSEEVAGVGLGIYLMREALQVAYDKTPQNYIHTRKALKGLVKAADVILYPLLPTTEKFYDLKARARKETINDPD